MHITYVIRRHLDHLVKGYLVKARETVDEPVWPARLPVRKVC
jgi:hypothetical protein